MKRILAIVLIILSITATCGVVFADTDNTSNNTEKENSSTRYTFFGDTSTDFYISGKTARWTLRAGKQKAYDSATVTTTLYKKNSGSITSYTNTFYNSNINISNSRILSSRGTYYVKFTIKCYKGGALKETITITTGNDTY